MITTAYVNIWNKRVGAVAWDESNSLASFEFEPSYLSNNWDIAPLTMPIEQGNGRIFSFPANRNNNTFKGMPGLLADVLPDKYGNSLINAWLTSNGRNADSMNPVEMLCFIGKRGMGALEFEPVLPNTNDKASVIEIETLITIAQQILAGRKDFQTNLPANESKALSDILKIGTSAGGARAKAVIAFNEVTKEVRSGQADAPKGFTHWLLKFDGISDQQLGTSSGYGRIEMAYYLMAIAAEIEMSECRLLEENGRAHFMTRRFDRLVNGDKVHVQSFCGIAHYDFNEVASYSYEQLFETMRRLYLPYSAAEQLFRRMVFNVMARNCDDHTKNFSFMMDTTGEWSLAPAFDVCHSYRPGSIWVSQHSLSINGKRQHITKEDLMAVAKKMNIKKAASIIDQIRMVVSNWKDFASQVNVETSLKNAVAETLISI